MKSIHDFTEFLSKLAPEGETLLLVRQKPRMVDGKVETHPDGAVKATWPAMLPTKSIKADWAIYANTASFIIDRFSNGKPSAGAANCEFVLCMVLDDVGDSEKAPNIPPLEPTWKMETSPNSFQWGYVFSEQPTKGEFSAAIRAIADAGYTDPGACNPVRNFRLPGSVNLKPGRGNVAAQLVEFEPSREFTLEQICTALGVTPSVADTATRKPIRLTDLGDDDVAQWLSVQGLVLSPPNPQGWMGVICPNSAQHSDSNPEGRYNPTMRAFCCLHSHCVDLDSSVFLEWVGDQGGPTHDPGLRDELLAALHTQTLAKLTPTDAFPDAGAQMIAEIERKELGRVEKADWYSRFAYIRDDDAYFDMLDRSEISRSSFNALFRHITCKSIHSGRRIEASVCFDENRQNNGAPAIRGLTYASGEGVLVTLDGEVFGNRWRNARPDVGAGDATDAEISPWLSHMALLVPDLRERSHIMDVMAYKVQHPQAKINHAVLHGGTQGCGKDTLWAPMLWAICGEHDKNKGMMDGDTINSQWGYQLEAEILVLNELREPEAKERRALANRLKPVIAAPPDMLPINRKGLHPYMMLNRLFVLAFSNDRAPISIESSDRRWFCLWSEAPRMSADDAHAIWSWYTSGGFAGIARWLYARDVSRFNPAATPMVTDFKLSMVEDGRSMAEEYLIDVLTREIGEFSHGVIGAPFHGLRDRVAGIAPAGVKIPQAALLHALAEAGWVSLGRIASARYPTKKQVYISPRIARMLNSSTMTKSDVRDALEGTPEPNVVRLR